MGAIVPSVQKSHNGAANGVRGWVHAGFATMPRLNVVTRSGERHTIEGTAGHSLKEVLVAGGIDEINALSNCGGCCACGTCHVFLDVADVPRVPKMHSQEDDLLGIHEKRQPTSRLSCQVVLTNELDGLTVTVAPDE
jgi:2Fe-2S ferredoxin